MNRIRKTNIWQIQHPHLSWKKKIKNSNSNNKPLSKLKMEGNFHTSTMRKWHSNSSSLPWLSQSRTVLCTHEQEMYSTRTCLCVSPSARELYKNLGPDEVANLFQATHRIRMVVGKQSLWTSLTFSIKDGPSARWAKKHIHTHIPLRKDRDGHRNDGFYDSFCDELQHHDEEEEKRSNLWRPEEKMAAEAVVWFQWGRQESNSNKLQGSKKRHPFSKTLQHWKC